MNNHSCGVCVFLCYAKNAGLLPAFAGFFACVLECFLGVLRKLVIVWAMSIFFDDLELQIIERDLLDKTVLPEAGLCVLLEFADVAVEPDRFAEVKTDADFIKRPKDFVCPRILAIVNDHGIAEHMIFFPYFCP